MAASQIQMSILTFYTHSPKRTKYKWRKILHFSAKIHAQRNAIMRRDECNQSKIKNLTFKWVSTHICCGSINARQGENYAKQWPFIIYFAHIGKDAIYTQLKKVQQISLSTVRFPGIRPELIETLFGRERVRERIRRVCVCIETRLCFIIETLYWHL